MTNRPAHGLIGTFSFVFEYRQKPIHHKNVDIMGFNIHLQTSTTPLHSCINKVD